MKKRIALILATLILLGMFYFSDVNAGVQTLNLTSRSKTITAGQSFQCKLNGLKANKVKWSSSDKKIASVNKKGVVKGISSGKATITGKYKGIKFTINVTVTANARKILVENNQKYEYLGKKIVSENGEKHLIIIYRYTNNNTTPNCFNYSIGYEAYQNGLELDTDQGNNELTMCKDGASVKVEIEYILRNKSDVEFFLYGNKTHKRIIHIK